MSDGKVNISRTVLRAIKLFGGVQVVSNLCSVALNKLVAVWIGPAGMGLFSIFNSAIDMLRSGTSLGLRTSAVRDIAEASEAGDTHRLATVIAVVRRWAWFISIFGAITTLALAPTLSKWSFGTYDHLWDYVLLASVLLFNGFANSELAILQGLEKLKPLANASLLGAVMGLALSIPLFYWFRIDSIIMSLVVYHAALLVAALIFRHKGASPVKVTNRQAVREGASFVRLGLLMTLSEFITMIFNYIFSAYLNRVAGTETVGFYQSGYSLVGRYIGLVLTALTMEYYPRITRVCRSRLRTHVFASQEINIMMLCLIPVIAAFLIARELIVSLLYSEEFHAIIPYVSFAVIGTALRAYSWFLAIVIVARGDGKAYIVTESLSVVTGFALNVVCYHLWGLKGLGIAFCLWYAAYCVIVGAVYFRRYRYTVSRQATALTIATIIVSFAIMMLLDSGMLWIAVAVAAVVSILALLRLRKIAR